jgi:hypothetical protein
MIAIPASFSHDLNWKLPPQLPPLIHFDFDFPSPFFINDTAFFQAYALALDHFTKTVWPQIHSQCQGFILFEGSLEALHTLRCRAELSLPETATLFASYLHRLASFLPDEPPIYCLFDTSAFSKGEAAHLLSEERFIHLQLSLTPTTSPTAVLLPPDELCTPPLILQLTEILEENPSLRVIPESKLCELWHGLDELIVFEEALSKYGRRQLLGFEAAGGKVRSRGIRTPDPLLPKQLR